jgi:hypothetical protein
VVAGALYYPLRKLAAHPAQPSDDWTEADGDLVSEPGSSARAAG